MVELPAQPAQPVQKGDGSEDNPRFIERPTKYPMPAFHVGTAEKLDIEENAIDLIITSPKYNLGSHRMDMGGRAPRDAGIGYDDTMSEPDYQAWQVDCLREWYRVAAPGASLFLQSQRAAQATKADSPPRLD